MSFKTLSLITDNLILPPLTLFDNTASLICFSNNTVCVTAPILTPALLSIFKNPLIFPAVSFLKKLSAGIGSTLAVTLRLNATSANPPSLAVTPPNA